MSTAQLPDTGFLSRASDDLRRVLDKLASEVELDTGEILFEEGTDGQAFYALISGKLEVSVLSVDGRKLALDVMRPGALFGEIALFDPGVRTATMTALSPSKVLRIRNSDVLREVRRTPELAIDLIQLAGQRMRWMNKQLHEQVFLPMPLRLARKVLYLSQDSRKTETRLALSQAELAEYVGATREAVSKTLSGWKKLGLVEASRGGLLIRDRNALQVIAGLEQI